MHRPASRCAEHRIWGTRTWGPPPARRSSWVGVDVAVKHVVGWQAAREPVARHREGASLVARGVEPAGKLASPVLGGQEQGNEARSRDRGLDAGLGAYFGGDVRNAARAQQRDPNEASRRREREAAHPKARRCTWRAPGPRLALNRYGVAAGSRARAACRSRQARDQLELSSTRSSLRPMNR